MKIVNALHIEGCREETDTLLVAVSNEFFMILLREFKFFEHFQLPFTLLANVALLVFSLSCSL